MFSPLVSVVVPCYNQEAYLNEALQSVADQTYSAWECLIVDDGSPDQTAEMAAGWVKRDPRFRLIKKVNGGLSSARNIGIKEARGEYILPLDADDKISANYIEGCIAYINTYKAKVVYGCAVFFGEKSEKWNLPDYDYRLMLTRNLIFCTAMFARKDWESIGGYDEKMKDGLEDWDFWLRLLSPEDHVQRNEQIVFYYRIKEDSMITNLIKNKEREHKTHRYLYLKHIDKMSEVITSPIQLYLDNEELRKYRIWWEMLKKTPLGFLGMVFKKIKQRAAR